MKSLLIAALLVASSSALASSLNCEVRDFGNRNYEALGSAIAKVELNEGPRSVVMQNVLKDGNYGCQVSYNGTNHLSIRLFRADMVIAESVDLAFSADKKVETLVQQKDVSEHNLKVRYLTDKSFAAGMCRCKSAE